MKRPPESPHSRRNGRQVHDQVLSSGGLHIIGTERHESRRVDNQLRGRAGRQGDPGSSRFYLSLEDPLLRIFASDRVASIMERLKMPEGEAIEHPWVTRAIENAQRKVEARNFDMRKQLLEYDDVSNDQRKVIYAQRNELLETDDISDTIRAMREDVIGQTFSQYIPHQSMEEQWDVPGLEKALFGELQLQLPLTQWLEEDDKLGEDGLLRRIIEAAHEPVPGQAGTGGRRSAAPLRARRHAAEHGHPLARAPGGAGSSAPGHPPARLRTEEPEAGIQARSFRTVLRLAGAHQGRSHPDHHDGAGKERG